MKILRNLEVAGALFQGGTGPEAQVGDQVKLFLDTTSDPGFPNFILGVIQHPIVKIYCGTKTSYSVEYDEADLMGSASAIVPGNVLYATVVSAVDILSDRIDNIVVGDASGIVQNSAFSNASGNTTITLPVGCKVYTVYGTFTGAAGTRIIILDTTNAQAGAVVSLVANLPSTPGIVIEVRNATAGGALIDTVTTDASGDDATFTLGFTTAWTRITTNYPN